jgi:hypothetical protein
MKILPIATLCLFVQPLFTPVQEPARAQSDLEKRVAALEEELAALKAARTQDAGFAEETIAYLEAQSQSAAKMLAVLDESEQLGFTAGINFRSREVLFAGLRSYWAEAQKGVPKAPKTKAAAAPPAPRGSGG